MAKLGDDEERILDESMPYLSEKFGDLAALTKHGCLTIAQCAGLLPAILTSEAPDADATEAFAHRLMLALLDVSNGDLAALHPDTMLPWSQYLRMIESCMFGADGLQAPMVTPAWLVTLEECERWHRAKGTGVDLSAVRADLAALKSAAASETPEKTAPPVSVVMPTEKSKDGPAWYDIEKERGCRRLILENWKTIVSTCGPGAKASQILRQLKTLHGSSAELPTLKTIHNCRKQLLDEKLIP